MNIILSGPPFSGKTTIGTALAQKLNWPLINTDTLLEEKFGISCPEQFKLSGNQKFRDNELELLKKLEMDPQNRVISLGGGTLTSEHNALIIKRLGFLICLQCSFQVLYQRLLACGRKPAYLDPDHLEESFRQLLKSREQHYLQHADFLLDVTTSSPLESAMTIIQEYKDKYGQ